MKNEYKVTTKYNKGLILQETSFPGQDDIRDISTNIIKLQEGGVREALIKLGWTPPESLADIRAEAVNSVMKNCNIVPQFGSEIMGTVSVIEIVEYANRIKEG